MHGYKTLVRAQLNDCPLEVQRLEFKVHYAVVPFPIQFDWVYWTGDLPPHNVWNQSREDQVEVEDSGLPV